MSYFSKKFKAVAASGLLVMGGMTASYPVQAGFWDTIIDRAVTSATDGVSRAIDNGISTTSGNVQEEMDRTISDAFCRGVNIPDAKSQTTYRTGSRVIVTGRTKTICVEPGTPAYYQAQAALETQRNRIRSLQQQADQYSRTDRQNQRTDALNQYRFEEQVDQYEDKKQARQQKYYQQQQPKAVYKQQKPKVVHRHKQPAQTTYVTPAVPQRVIQAPATLYYGQPDVYLNPSQQQQHNLADVSSQRDKIMNSAQQAYETCNAATQSLDITGNNAQCYNVVSDAMRIVRQSDNFYATSGNKGFYDISANAFSDAAVNYQHKVATDPANTKWQPLAKNNVRSHGGYTPRW